ncbi:MAG: thiolase family protein [Clostridioides sp.]|jgi:acetyl-CoA acyltransferase|nr:thiolase family protein [Clostridioides sp.]
MENVLKTAVIVAYGRSAAGRARKGGLAHTNPVDFGAAILKGVLDKVPTLDKTKIEDVIVGCAKPENVQGSNFARIIALRAGLSNDVPGQTVNRFCSSGLQSIATAANMIMASQAEIVVAGGVESMTAIPMGATDDSLRSKWMLENNPGVYTAMGITAENVAAKYGVTREQMDQMAYESHMKAATAQDAGKFDREIIPIEVEDAEGNKTVFCKDDGIRRTTSMESLASLKASFKEDGSVTAGNSSQVTDGASFVVVMSEDKAKELGLKAIAKFIGYAVAGVDPNVMGIGPTKAIPKVMNLTGLSVDDMDVIELNEAFAAQAIPCINELGLDPKKVNPNGGALALGHPLGATGAILTCKALSELKRTGGKYALISMCIGGGMGAAGIFESVD